MHQKILTADLKLGKFEGKKTSPEFGKPSDIKRYRKLATLMILNVREKKLVLLTFS